MKTLLVWEKRKQWLLTAVVLIVGYWLYSQHLDYCDRHPESGACQEEPNYEP